MAEQIRIIRYTTQFKGRRETMLGAFKLQTDIHGQPVVAFPIDVTGKTQNELTHLIVDLWGANQVPPLEFPEVVNFDETNEQVLVWKEQPVPV